jgi:nucleoside-diphosphate-sugar epimerase
MKILVTGGAGYIGSVLIEKLLNLGHDVTVYDNLLYRQNSLSMCCKFKNFNFENVDINDVEYLINQSKNFDIIIPLAAIVGAPACKLKPTLAKMTNFDSISTFLKNISKNILVIYPTTNSGYGIGEADKFCDENSPLKPISQYGKEKVEIEKILLSRKNSISLRLATVFGVSPRMRLDLLVNDFTYKAFVDKYIVLFEEKFKRNYIHVQDVTDTFLFSIKNSKNMIGEPFNVGLSNANISKLELCNVIKKVIGEFHISVSEIGKDEDKRDYIVSNKKLESLGWKAQYSLEDGIEELIKYFSSMKRQHNNF